MKEHRYAARLDVLRSPFELYSAICRVVPHAHAAGWSVAPVAAGFLIRGPDDPPRIRAIEVRGREMIVDFAGSHELEPALSLTARCVIVRLTGGAPKDTNELRARVDAHVQTRAAAIGAAVRLGDPQAVRVHGRLIRGFSARAVPLTDAASLVLQRVGIGGKRSMGCGVFCAEGSRWS